MKNIKSFIYLTIVLVAAALISGLWMMIAKGPGSESLNAVRGNNMTIAQYLTQETVIPYLQETQNSAEIMAMYASSEYFKEEQLTDEAKKYDIDNYLIFYVTESNHSLYLPEKPIKPTLDVDGTSYEPIDYILLTDSGHHRSVVWRFDKMGEQGKQLLTNKPQDLSLVFSPDQTDPIEWNVPIHYPNNLIHGFTIGLILSAVAGLFTAIAPCLLQLTLFYLTTITNISMQEVQKGQLNRESRRSLMKASLSFVIGFTFLYTSAGALAGFLGDRLSDWFSNWNQNSQPVLVVAGIAVILFALYSGAKANAPIVCKIPLIRPRQKKNKPTIFSTIFMGIAYSLGCTACFGGALLATLLIYIGSRGSVLEGTVILLIFSLAVGIPFLLASYFISRTLKYVEKIQSWAPFISLASSIIMILLGVALIAGQFHYVSNTFFAKLF